MPSTPQVHENKFKKPLDKGRGLNVLLPYGVFDAHDLFAIIMARFTCVDHGLFLSLDQRRG